MQNSTIQTIVLIHGYGFDERTWSPVELAFDGFRVVRLALPGFGNESPQTPYTIESLAQHYWSELESSVSGRVHLVGHSMGGYVCMEMVAQRPLGVASLVLVHSHVFADTAEKKVQRSATIEHIKAYGRDAVVRKMVPSLFADGMHTPEIIKALISRGLSYGDNAWSCGAQAMRDRKDHAETLKQIKVPVLMIAGEKDTAVPLELVFKQAALTERNLLHIYPGVGHMVMYENPGRLISDILSFYAQVVPA